MKKILISLLALIALAVVGWFGIYQIKAPDIQADIKQRVGEALASNSLDWVNYEVDGRDVTLRGEATSQQMVLHALDTADIYGLNSLTSEMTVNGSVGAGSAGQQASASSVGSGGADNGQAAAANSQNSPETGAENGSAGETGSQSAAAGSGQNSDGAVADVAVQNLETSGVAALPITMNISRDESGEYIFNGTTPDVTFKETVDKHLISVGADPSKAVWQVELSSAKAPQNWQKNILHSISAVHSLKEGEANLTANSAVIKGIATSQDASDSAETFAQQLAGDFTTDMDFSIAAPVMNSAAKESETVTLVGSDKYAAKFCQTEFDAALKLQKIVFESGSSRLQSKSAGLLGQIAQVAGRCPNHAIQVHGYTDSRGSASVNKRLSKARADAVVANLIQRGIEKERLVAIGHGEKNPVASNKTEAGRAKNRRIKLIVKGLKK